MTIEQKVQFFMTITNLNHTFFLMHMPFYKIIVKGIVQGVGFRPFVYRQAVKRNLLGSVNNVGEGVEIIINDKEFIETVINNKPPLSRIDSFSIQETDSEKKIQEFKIIKSKKTKGTSQLPPDIFTCKDCIKELRDKSNRRYGYYFISCTNCGPRFSMIKDYPYDRPYTSMQEFEMCSECRNEYEDPLDRRYHAQTIACPDCGPRLKLMHKKKDISAKTDKATIKKAVDIIRSGEFLSIKGVGGFHICSKTDPESVKRVREFLKRANKPFALMVKDTCMAEKYVKISKKEKDILESPQRPIVVLKKNKKGSLEEVSELDSLGVMLPYTALHYLLFDHIDEPLVMTSCNIPGKPVALTEKLGKYFLTHERKIVNRCDDSVIKIIKKRPIFLRRSRGFAPVLVHIKKKCNDTLALGAELSSAICAAKKDRCFLSQHIGKTSELETFDFLKETIDRFVRLTRLKPEIIACDLHPGYNTTKYAKELSKKYKAELVKIQHHKAHVAGVAAEHNLKDYVGIAMDGLGYGEDGKLWGGEIFLARKNSIKRVGHLEPQIQIGGDSAAIYPKKMLLGIFSKFLSDKQIKDMNLFDNKDTELYLQAIKNNFNTIETTSAGRILDAVAALLGICEKRTYEGRPPMLLESIAQKPYNINPEIKKENGKYILMTIPLFKFLLKNLKKDKKRLAATAQLYLAKGTYEIAKQFHKPIVFSGGVAYNKKISGYMIRKGIFINKKIPAGDGGICFGQAYLANG
ncbi:carbamoyltransferase HypF [Candidatus Woesearchaeota archaeon]|nr:carbamoyltransferase HypF [Candidatus Woesearchaeota archaeon]